MTALDLEEVRQRLRGRSPNEIEGSHSWAAVSITLREGEDGPEVFMIRRADQPSDPWSGQMAFPGGRRDEGDESLLATARRETLEEVGLDLGRDADHLGPLDDLQAVARGERLGMVIRPFVFELHREVQVTPHNYEVAETLWAPVRPMASGELDAVRPYEFQGRSLALPAYDVDGRIVWGLTYHMLRSFFALVR